MNDYTEEKKREHFRRALSNYAPILELGDRIGEQLEKADEGLSFPTSPTDILEYLGNIEPLCLDEYQKDWVRDVTLKLIDKHGAQHVWDYRFRYKCEAKYICHNLGL